MRSSNVLILSAMALCVAACEQSTQDLPFGPDPDFVARRVIGPDGGRISHPAGISIEFPAGALGTSAAISVSVGTTSFPSSVEGEVIQGTHYIVSPANLDLKLPVVVDMAIGGRALDATDRLRLGIASPLAETSIATDGLTFDVTSSILRGGVDGLGPMAAVIADNALVVTPQSPPVLSGGFAAAFGGGQSSAARPMSAVRGGGTAAASQDPITFSVRCSYQGQPPRCVSTGIIELWASQEIQDRLSGRLVLLNPDVDGSLEFTDFVDGLPTRASGSLVASGTLRVQLGQAVTSFFVDDEFVTSGTDGSTAIEFDGSTITFLSTSVGGRSTDYQLVRRGDGVLELTLRGSKTVEFENADGTFTSATLFIDLLLTG